jgi:hypothetical protein
MMHDFIDPYTDPKTVRRDSKGGSCTIVNGVMSYYVTVLKWSKCSKYYQITEKQVARGEHHILRPTSLWPP